MPKLDYKYIARLVEKAKLGNSDAFAELYAATYQREYTYAYNYLKDAYLAQDALQETFILALKNLKTLQDPQAFVSWLNQICFRVCFNMQRKQSYQCENAIDMSVTDSVNHQNPESSPEDAFIVVEQQRYILDQVMDLPPLEAEAIILRYYKNMKVDDCARLMNVSKSTVKRYINRGLEHLKIRLKTYE